MRIDQSRRDQRASFIFSASMKLILVSIFLISNTSLLLIYFKFISSVLNLRPCFVGYHLFFFSSFAYSDRLKNYPTNEVRKRKAPDIDKKSLKYISNRDALRQLIDTRPIRSATVRKQDRQGIDPSLFLTWCEKVLGIQTLLQIDFFNYTNHLLQWHQDYLKEEDEMYDTASFSISANKTTPPSEMKDDIMSSNNIQIRGLAASRDIQEGEVLISIPLHALISIPNTIDHDPILSRILGLDARLHYGWAYPLILEDGTQVTEEDPYYEIPLLVVAILYHRSLGAEMSPIWYYISSLLSSPIQSIPILLEPRELKDQYPESVRQLTLRIRNDVKEMYYTVMNTLIEDYGEVFGPPTDEVDPTEWMFSLDKFMWAFVIVNSHYWRLPIAEWTTIVKPSHNSEPADVTIVANNTLDPDSSKLQLSRRENGYKHSFLAPFADLINFGPPCTHGIINNETHTFDIVALCPFQSGQEVTFYYTDDCEDIMIANYGFLHPLIPPCPTVEEIKAENMKLKEQVRSLNLELTRSQNNFKLVEEKMNHIRDACNCGDMNEIGDSGVRGNRDEMDKSDSSTHGRIRRISRRSIEEMGF